eukprot:SAG22_NODE_872_length_6726_cov_2.255923_5_plen_136_part_00
MSRAVKRRYARRAKEAELREFSVGKKRSAMRRAADELKDFTSAFADPCFRNLWLQGFVGCVAGIIEWHFEFFWYEDCFPYGYHLFNYKVASSAGESTAVPLYCRYMCCCLVELRSGLTCGRSSVRSLGHLAAPDD